MVGPLLLLLSVFGIALALNRAKEVGVPVRAWGRKIADAIVGDDPQPAYSVQDLRCPSLTAVRHDPETFFAEITEMREKVCQ